MRASRKTPFYNKLEDCINEHGGMFNAHLHLDRAGTLDGQYFDESSKDILNNSYISLHEKHYLINDIHSGTAYSAKDLKRRLHDYLDMMVACNTKRADTLVDVTADDVGILALDTFLQVKAERAADIDLQVGAYSPLGFIDSEPERWNIFLEGADKADFIAALPEADDQAEYPDHIGFHEHCRRMLDLSLSSGKMLHVHTDQRNEPSEDGTERLINILKECETSRLKTDKPTIWAVHMISPSTYSESRFNSLVDNLLEQNVGVICCPSAALGMRQLRSLTTPTYNSIPRVLELLAAGIQVRLASDNIADICSPSTTADLVDEIFILSAAIRFYDVEILAKLACGKTINEQERHFIKSHLAMNKVEIDKVLSGSINKAG